MIKIDMVICLYPPIIMVRLEFEDVGFCRRKKTGEPKEKP